VAKSTKFTPATPLSQHNNLSWKHTTFPTSLFCPKWSIRGFTNTKKKERKKKVRKKKKLQKKEERSSGTITSTTVTASTIA
jgi:hypothetical protein